MNVEVTIPVSIGGYTGQRDQWQEHEYAYSVTLEDDGTVVLRNRGTSGRTVKFNRADFEKAIKFYEEFA